MSSATRPPGGSGHVHHFFNDPVSISWFRLSSLKAILWFGGVSHGDLIHGSILLADTLQTGLTPRQAAAAGTNRLLTPEYIDGMLAREQRMSTYPASGVSIPHGMFEKPRAKSSKPAFPSCRSRRAWLWDEEGEKKPTW